MARQDWEVTVGDGPLGFVTGSFVRVSPEAHTGSHTIGQCDLVTRSVRGEIAILLAVLQVLWAHSSTFYPGPRPHVIRHIWRHPFGEPEHLGYGKRQGNPM